MSTEDDNNLFDFNKDGSVNQNTEDSNEGGTDDNTDGDSNNEPNYLDQLVGEGKKFKDVGSLARGKHEADQFISELERQNKELRDELNKQDFARDLLEKVKNQTMTNDDNNTSTHRNTEPDHTRSNDSGDGGDSNKSEELEQLVQRLLKEEEDKKASKTNMEVVQSRLQTVWGENAKRELERNASNLGLTADYLKSVAEKSPDAFFRMVGVPSSDSNGGESGNRTAPPVGDKNAAAYENSKTNHNNGDRTWAWYEELRKTDRRKYFSPEVQRQLIEDKRKLGDKFGMPSR